MNTGSKIKARKSKAWNIHSALKDSLERRPQWVRPPRCYTSWESLISTRTRAATLGKLQCTVSIKNNKSVVDSRSEFRVESRKGSRSKSRSGSRESREDKNEKKRRGKFYCEVVSKVLTPDRSLTFASNAYVQ